LLAGFLVVIAGGGLIARGHYRYIRYSKAEAASAEAANAGSTAAGS